MNSGIIKYCQLPVTTFEKKKEENWSAIAESIYRFMFLFLDHILYRRAHFVHDAQSASLAVLLMSQIEGHQLHCNMKIGNAYG